MTREKEKLEQYLEIIKGHFTFKRGVVQNPRNNRYSLFCQQIIIYILPGTMHKERLERKAFCLIPHEIQKPTQ